MQFDDKLARGLTAAYHTRDAARRRAAVLDAAQLRPDESVLDIGTGPGFLAEQMAEAVGPGGRVHGIDMSEPMLAMARQRCAGQPWVSFERAVATALPLEDASFDVAISVQVYEFIAGIMTALSEMYRALRPGGRGVIVSTDWDAIAWQASDSQRMRRVLDAFSEHCPHNALPRILAPKLRQAGFTVAGQRVITQFNPVYDPDTYSYHLIPLVRSFVAGRKGVTEQEAAAWAEDLRQMGERGEYFFSVNQYLHLVRKPG